MSSRALLATDFTKGEVEGFVSELSNLPANAFGLAFVVIDCVGDHVGGIDPAEVGELVEVDFIQVFGWTEVFDFFENGF
jgi:hypothetical protein